MKVPSDAADPQVLEAERQLVERARDGDRDALRPLFDQYAKVLYAAVILPRVGDPATAEDILRDTFVTALQKIGGFEWQGRSVYPWLRQIACNKVVDVHRRRARSGRALATLAEESPIETAPEEAADARLIAAEERRNNAVRIERAMRGLPPRYREAIQLRLVEELPREECAQRLGVTVGTFDVLVFRAIRAFRKQFGDRDDGGESTG